MNASLPSGADHAAVDAPLPPPVAHDLQKWLPRQRVRPLPDDVLLVGRDGDCWLGMLYVWLDDRQVSALCSGNALGDIEFLPLIEQGAGRDHEIAWWCPWWA